MKGHPILPEGVDIPYSCAPKPAYKMMFDCMYDAIMYEPDYDICIEGRMKFLKELRQMVEDIDVIAHTIGVYDGAVFIPQAYKDFLAMYDAKLLPSILRQ